jgi:hypothetical protein
VKSKEMKRRSFVKSTALMAAAGAVAPGLGIATENPAKSSREFYELREYALKNDVQQKLVTSYFKDALIPALTRIGNGPVGVFTELKPAGQTRVFALIPYRSTEDFAMIIDNLANDNVYLKAADA